MSIIIIIIIKSVLIPTHKTTYLGFVIDSQSMTITPNLEWKERILNASSVRSLKARFIYCEKTGPVYRSGSRLFPKSAAEQTTLHLQSVTNYYWLNLFPKSAAEKTWPHPVRHHRQCKSWQCKINLPIAARASRNNSFILASSRSGWFNAKWNHESVTELFSPAALHLIDWIQ